MIADLERRERIVGWTLAAVVAVHLLILRPQPAIQLAALGVLLIGAMARGSRIVIPRWLGELALLAGVLDVFLTQGWERPIGLPGELAAMVGALLLLRPMTPRRGQWVLLCLIVMMVGAIVKPYTTVSFVYVILEAAALLLLAEIVYRPPEVLVSFWVSVLRSLRLIVPVGLVVTGIFSFFPDFSEYTRPVFSGLGGGSGHLDPGGIARLAQSHRVALTARFPTGKVPAPGNLYWRGPVLEINEGLRWKGVEGARNRELVLQNGGSSSRPGVLMYTEQLSTGSGEVVPMLDHAIYVEAKRGDDDVAAPDRGAGMVSVVGEGPLSIQAVSVLTPLTDRPRAEIDHGALRVPDKIKEREAVQQIVKRVFKSGPWTLEEKLTALEDYLREGGFRYSLRPGRVDGLEDFLVRKRLGFCGHYAAASAALLRMAGVPTRVVTGYRGGEWNPWLRSITVRDSNAHAWVEAWDETAQHWRRFDPTDAVAPDLSRGIEWEMDSANWPWYRKSWSYSQALANDLGERFDLSWKDFTSSEAWETLNPILFGLFGLTALLWLLRRYIPRRAASAREEAFRLLAELEIQAARMHRRRKAGETPLAWLSRLEKQAQGAKEREVLRQVAACYEAEVYRPKAAGLLPMLRSETKRLVDLWRGRAK